MFCVLCVHVINFPFQKKHSTPSQNNQPNNQNPTNKPINQKKAEAHEVWYFILKREVEAPDRFQAIQVRSCVLVSVL